MEVFEHGQSIFPVCLARSMKLANLSNREAKSFEFVAIRRQATELEDYQNALLDNEERALFEAFTNELVNYRNTSEFMRKRFRVRMEEAKKRIPTGRIQKSLNSNLFKFVEIFIKLYEENIIDPDLLSLDEYSSELEKIPYASSTLISADARKLYPMPLAVFGHLYSFEYTSKPTRWLLRFYLTFPGFYEVCHKTCTEHWCFPRALDGLTTQR